MMLMFYLFFGGLMLSSLVLLKVYTGVPVIELKRRVKSGDQTAALLYKVATYAPSLQILLWALIGISGAVLFVGLARSLATWLALLVILALLWLGFAWLPHTKTTFAGKKLAEWAAPPLAWVLSKLYPLLRGIDDRIRKHRVTLHTGIYDKEDIVELLNRQQKQTDSRIDPAELGVIKGALVFGDKLVRDVMTPRRVAKMVSVDDAVGPLLLDELHKSGHSRFPVYEGKKDKIIGLLLLRDLMDVNSGGIVRDFMQKKVFYVHEEDRLRQALQAFYKSHRHLLIVVNSFEEVVGVLTLEDILEQILGTPIVDEFDQYDDLRAVAQKQAAKEHKQHQAEGHEPIEKPSEVIE